MANILIAVAIIPVVIAFVLIAIVGGIGSVIQSTIFR